MEIIATLAKVENRRRCTEKRLKILEDIFSVVGDDEDITIEKFQQILKSKNPFFVERMFIIFDKNGSNTLSKAAFMESVKSVIGRSPEEKLRLLFQIYDLDGDNSISLDELRHVIKCCMEENGLTFTPGELEELTVTLFEDADADGTGTITYEELEALVTRHRGLIENVSISIERWLLPPLPHGEGGRRGWRWPRKLSFTYIANNRVSFAFFAAYITLNIALFVTRAFKFAPDGRYMMFARAAGQCLNFNVAFSCILVLRKSITFLRSLGLAELLPLDQHIYYHKLTGCFIVGFSSLHATMHILHFIQESEEEFVVVPATDLLFGTWSGMGLVPGAASITGWIMVMSLIVMVFSSLPFMRRTGNFEIFYYCHLLYLVFWVCLLLHGPVFWQWFIAPGLLFVVEIICRVHKSYGSRGNTYIVQGILLPSKVVHLVIKRPPNFDFRPGDFVYVQIPGIAKAEWHPFTISSAPEMSDVLWLHIRTCGEWTKRVYDYFLEQEIRVDHLKLTESRSNFAPHVEVKRFGSARGQRLPSNVLQFTPILSESNDPNFGSSIGLNNNEDQVHLDRIEAIELPSIVINLQNSVEKSARKLMKRVNVIEEMQFQKKSLERKASTPIVPTSPPIKVLKRMHSTNVIIERAATSGFRRQSKVFLLPRPLECDEFGCRKIGSRPKGNLHEVEMGLEAEARLSQATTSGLKSASTSTLKFLTPRQEKEEEHPDLASNRKVITLETPLHLHLDGPYGSPSGHIFHTQHAVLIATGIGVTPFASILQSIMFRYTKAKNCCPSCSHTWTDPIPPTVMNLQKVDFVWINRDQKSFEWFVNLLSELEITQAELHEAERFLDVHMYITSALDKSDMKAIGLQLALDLMHEKEKRDLITGLKTRTQPGRPDWQEFFKDIAGQNKGRVTVFYCGPPELGRSLHLLCNKFHFSFRKENF